VRPFSSTPPAEGNLGENKPTAPKKKYEENLEYGYDSEEEEVQHIEPASSEPVPDITSKDYWEFNGEVLILHHCVPRTKLFVPTDANCPLPLKYLDVGRRTYTNLESKAENFVADFWTSSGARELSEDWTGKTCLPILRPVLEPGYKWIEGRPTRMQTTTRPDHLWPEIWEQMSKPIRENEIEKGKILTKNLREERIRCNKAEIPADDDDYFKIIAEVRARLGKPAPPAMPLLRNKPLPNTSTSYGASARSAKTCSSRPHQDHVAQRGFASKTYFGLVHTPVDIH